MKLHRMPDPAASGFERGAGNQKACPSHRQDSGIEPANQPQKPLDAGEAAALGGIECNPGSG
jgi:hypothetical protein